MPTRIMVVERPRRNLFAIPRALSDLLRSIWGTRPRAVATGPAAGAAIAEPALAIGSEGARFPALIFDATEQHRCVGCNLCVQICPSRCLTLVTEGPSEAASITQFELARASCIGCRACREVCPENALEMISGPSAERAADVECDSNLDLLRPPAQTTQPRATAVSSTNFQAAQGAEGA